VANSKWKRNEESRKLKLGREVVLFVVSEGEYTPTSWGLGRKEKKGGGIALGLKKKKGEQLLSEGGSVFSLNSGGLEKERSSN